MSIRHYGTYATSALLRRHITRQRDIMPRATRQPRYTPLLDCVMSRCRDTRLLLRVTLYCAICYVAALMLRDASVMPRCY